MTQRSHYIIKIALVCLTVRDWVQHSLDMCNLTTYARSLSTDWVTQFLQVIHIDSDHTL